MSELATKSYKHTLVVFFLKYLFQIWNLYLRIIPY